MALHSHSGCRATSSICRELSSVVMKVGPRSSSIFFVLAVAYALLSVIGVFPLWPVPLRAVDGLCCAPPFVTRRVSTSCARARARIIARSDPGARTRLIKQARTPADLWSISESPDCDLVHRATILFELAEMVKSSRDLKLGGGIAGTAEFQHLLKNIVTDLCTWKSSGSLKVTTRRKNDMITEQAKYLGNLIWALGELRPLISATLPAGEETILFESAVLASLEGVHDFVDHGCTLAICQMLFGLRGVGRSLQADAFFSASAKNLIQNIKAHSSDIPGDIASILISFGHYGLQDPDITQCFVEAKDEVKSEIWNLKNLVFAVKGYALYAHRCVHPTADPATFSVSLVKRSRQTLGIKMDSIPGKPALRISKITEGLVRRWNRLHPQWKLEEGDWIVNANGIDGSAKQLADEIVNRQSVTMVLRRGRAALQVRDRPASDGQVPVGVRDETMMQDLGRRLAKMLAQERDIQDCIKLTGNTITSYIQLGIRSEPLVDVVAQHIMRHHGRFAIGYTLGLLWGLGKMDIGGAAVVKVLVRHATSFLKSIDPGDMPVLYHALKKLGYSDSSPESLALQKAASRYSIGINELQRGDAVPVFWRDASAVEQV